MFRPLVASIDRRISQVGDIHPIRASDVVVLQEFGRGGEMAQLLTAPTLDMKDLLVKYLRRAETKLRMVPDILGVRFPQYRDDAGAGSEDEELVWVQDEREGLWASWGDGCVDLAACCARTCASADQAVFRLRAFVHYCGKPEEARRLVFSGHFVAYFQEQGTWYRSDDLRAAGRAMALDGRRRSSPTSASSSGWAGQPWSRRS